MPSGENKCQCPMIDDGPFNIITIYEEKKLLYFNYNILTNGFRKIHVAIFRALVAFHFF